MLLIAQYFGLVIYRFAQTVYYTKVDSILVPNMARSGCIWRHRWSNNRFFGGEANEYKLRTALDNPFRIFHIPVWGSYHGIFTQYILFIGW